MLTRRKFLGVLASAFVGLALPLKALNYDLPKVKEDENKDRTYYKCVMSVDGKVVNIFEGCIPFSQEEIAKNINLYEYKV